MEVLKKSKPIVFNARAKIKSLHSNLKHRKYMTLPHGKPFFCNNPYGRFFDGTPQRDQGTQTSSVSPSQATVAHPVSCHGPYGQFFDETSRRSRGTQPSFVSLSQATVANDATLIIKKMDELDRKINSIWRIVLAREDRIEELNNRMANLGQALEDQQVLIDQILTTQEAQKSDNESIVMWVRKVFSAQEMHILTLKHAVCQKKMEERVVFLESLALGLMSRIDFLERISHSHVFVLSSRTP